MNDEDYGSFQKGDRVRISEYGSYDKREGTVTTTSSSIYGNVQVLIDGCTSSTTFGKSSVIRLPEPLRIPAGRREEGKGIRLEDVRDGDTIKVVQTTKGSEGFKSVTIREGVVAVRTPMGGLATKDRDIIYYGVHSADTQLITLVAKAPDGVLAEIQAFPLDTILTWRYGKEDTLHVAVKTGKDHWQIIGADGNVRADTARVRVLIERANDTYEILKEGK